MRRRPRLHPTDRARSGSSSGRLSRSEIESRLKTIWRELLGFEDIGVDDSFFDLGGDSLRIGVMRDSIARGLGVDVSAASLLDLPTIRLIADHLLALQDHSNEPAAATRAGHPSSHAP